MTDPVTLKIWDLPTRLFHWSLLALVIACWWTAGEDGDIDWHMRCGYVVLALLLFRLVWGVLGSATARFASFVASPRAVLEYLSSARKNDALHTMGHNPAGGWMVLALLVMLLATSVAGLFANDNIMSEGPFAHRVSEGMSDLATAWHEKGFYALLALVGLHVGAIAFYLLAKKDNLVRPMLTGKKVANCRRCHAQCLVRTSDIEWCCRDGLAADEVRLTARPYQDSLILTWP